MAIEPLDWQDNISIWRLGVRAGVCCLSFVSSVQLQPHRIAVIFIIMASVLTYDWWYYKTHEMKPVDTTAGLHNNPGRTWTPNRTQASSRDCGAGDV